MKNLILIPALVFGTMMTASAQDVEKTELKFDYIQLPSKPLDKSLKSYNSKVLYNAEETNKKLMEDYEKAKANVEVDYQKALVKYEEDMKKAEAELVKEKAEYPAKVKAAEDAYIREMEIYNQKSTLQKLADKNLANEGKPYKQIPHEPYLREPNKPYKSEPQMPKLKKVFDLDQLAGSYLKLEGFTMGTVNAVTITATMGQLEILEPIITSKDMTRYDNGKSYPYKSYTIKVPYKRLIRVKVETPQGVIYDEVPAGVSEEKYIQNTSEITSESAARYWWENQRERTTENLETETVHKNMAIINDFLNSNYAFKRKAHEATVLQVKDKKQDYTDLATAYLSLVEGYNTLTESYDKTAAKAKIAEAIAIYEKALLESEMDNKRARINEEVTLAIYWNLIEAYVWNDDYAKAKTLYAKFSTFDASKKQKKYMDAIFEFGKDQYERYKGFYGK